MKKLLLIFAIATCVPVTAEAASLNSQLRSAQKAIKNNKLEEALKTLVDAQIDAPDNPLLAYHLGQVYYKMERYQEADAAFKQALRTDNAQLRADSTYALGNTAFKNGQLKEAIEFFSQAVDMRPVDEDAKYNLDMAREELRRLLEEQKKQQQERQQQQQEQQNQDNQQQCDNPQPSDNGDQNQQDSEQQKNDQQQSGQQQDQQEEQSADNQEQQDQQAAAHEQEQSQDEEQTDETDQKAALQAEQQTDQEDEKQQQPDDTDGEKQAREQDQEAVASEETEDEGQVSQREAEQTLRRLQEQPPAPTVPGKQRRRVTKDW